MRKFVLLFFLFVPIFLFAKGQKEQNVPNSSINQIVYKINTIDIQVDGRTKPFAIENSANIKTGTLIYGEENFQKYIAEKRQFFTSQRVFEESSITYSFGETDEYNQILVDLAISVKDSSNFIAFPIPKYDDGDLTLKLSANDFNFLGTLSPIEFDIGYQRDKKGNNGFLFESNIALPFELGGYIWTLDFANNLNAMQNKPVFYYNHLGLLLDIPVKETKLTFGVYESFSLNQEFNPAILPPEEIEDRDKTIDSDISKDQWYLNTTALARWKIPTGFDVLGLGELEYTPELDFSINYGQKGNFDDSRQEGYRKGFELTINQNLGFGKVDWKGNFRQGTIAMLQSQNTYNVRSGDWNNALFATGIYHKNFTDYTGFSGRIRWASWFNNYYDQAGYIVRGMPDENLAADFMLSINLQEFFRVFSVMPSQWFHNQKMRIFNFELHAAPFLDLALAQDPVHNKSFNFEDMIVTSGLELTIYPFQFKSSYLRASFGVNTRELFKVGFDVLSDENHRELYVGMGHYF